MYGTPSQTVGPYLRIGLEWLDGGDLIQGAGTADIPGKRVTIAGTVVDGNGILVPDAVLEFWQADANGVFPSIGADGKPTQAFRGFARVCTDADGAFTLKTVMPGSVDGPNGRRQAPHIAVQVAMRGLLKPLYTRVVLPGSAGQRVRSAARGRAGRAACDADRSGPADGDTFTWNVVVQGVGEHVETVFFDF